MFRIRALMGIAILSMSLQTAIAGRMYWADAGTHVIQRANQDGSAVVTLVHAGFGSAPQGVALDLIHARLYWVEADGGKIRRANLDGSGIEDLIGSVGPAAIALNLPAGKMYWADTLVTGQIHRANLDGSAGETIVSATGNPMGIALDLGAGKMYWTDRGRHWIKRAELDGSGVETLVTGLLDPRNIALDVPAGKMYWADAQEGKIQRANLDGSDLEDVVVGLKGPHGIALDFSSRSIYWTDLVTDKIQRSTFSGANVQDLVTGLSAPTGIALETVLDVSIDIKPGSGTNVVNLRSHGVIPIAILSSSTFDAMQVDPATLTLAAAGVKLVGNGRNYACFRRYANDDGLPDLVCNIETTQLIIQSGQSTLVLEARTFGGQSIRGEDTIKIVP